MEKLLWFEIDSTVMLGRPDVIRFEIPYEGSVIMYRGNSGCGKSFMFDKLASFLKATSKLPQGDRLESRKGLNNGKVVLINWNSSIEDIKHLDSITTQDYVIIIDNWDYIAETYPSIVDTIGEGIYSRSSSYILMGRGLHGLYILDDCRLDCHVAISEEFRDSTTLPNKIRQITYRLEYE